MSRMLQPDEVARKIGIPLNTFYAWNSDHARCPYLRGFPEAVYMGSDRPKWYEPAIDEWMLKKHKEANGIEIRSEGRSDSEDHDRKTEPVRYGRNKKVRGMDDPKPPEDGR